MTAGGESSWMKKRAIISVARGVPRQHRNVKYRKSRRAEERLE
jgi:hypothetical protein